MRVNVGKCDICMYEEMVASFDSNVNMHVDTLGRNCGESGLVNGNVVNTVNRVVLGVGGR